jgi:isocitrate dehydrogenase
MIDSRGVKVWPAGFAETFCADNFRCRFLSDGGTTAQDIIELLGRVAGKGVDVVKTEYLRKFDGQAGFSLSQGE